MEKLEISLTLEQQQLDWLQSMAKKYSLPTADKALRIVIMYAKQVKDSAAAMFEELSANSEADKNPVTGKHAIDQVHDTILEEFRIRYKLSSKNQAWRNMQKLLNNTGEPDKVLSVFLKAGGRKTGLVLKQLISKEHVVPSILNLLTSSLDTVSLSTLKVPQQKRRL